MAEDATRSVGFADALRKGVPYCAPGSRMGGLPLALALEAEDDGEDVLLALEWIMS